LLACYLKLTTLAFPSLAGFAYRVLTKNNDVKKGMELIRLPYCSITNQFTKVYNEIDFGDHQK